jgi:hypothetical protein
MNVLKTFWSQGVLITTYLINQLPSKTLNFTSHAELLTGKTLNLMHLRVFGCLCYVHI